MKYYFKKNSISVVFGAEIPFPWGRFRFFLQFGAVACYCLSYNFIPIGFCLSVGGF